MANFKNTSFINGIGFVLSALLLFIGCSDDQSIVSSSVNHYSNQGVVPSEPTYIYVENDNLKFDSYSNSKSIPVFCDGDWEIEEYPNEWVEANCGNCTLSLEVDDNDGSSRETSMTLCAGEYHCVIHISQEGEQPHAVVQEIWADVNQNYYGTW